MFPENGDLQIDAVTFGHGQRESPSLQHRHTAAVAGVAVPRDPTQYRTSKDVAARILEPNRSELSRASAKANVLRARGCSASVILDADREVLLLKLERAHRHVEDLKAELTALDAQRTHETG